METLDNFLKSELNVDLEADEQGEIKPKTVQETLMSSRQRESFTTSLLRDDIVAPNIVYFSRNNAQVRRYRRILIMVLVLLLSLSGMLRFRKFFSSFQHSITTEEKGPGNSHRTARRYRLRL
jgi:flagellar basal body-associated protein FliL